MSKRGAEIQGSKETGLDTMSMNADTPQRATAAQLAKRTIKPLNSRRMRVGSPSTTTLRQQPPFSNINPNIMSNPPSTSTNSFGFGQTQSFQQGTSPNVESQAFGDKNNTSFSFFGSQTNSAPSSFNFNTQASSQPVNNPFSNIGSTQGSDFQGFKGNMFDLPPSTNVNGFPSAGGSGVFGSGTATQQDKPSPFSFGNTNSAFPAAASNNPFGQPATPSPFAVSQPFTAEANKSGDQMQMSPDAKPAASKSMFNVSAPAPPSFSPTITSSQPTSFGNIFAPASAPKESVSTTTTSAPAAAWSFPASTPSTSLFSGFSKPGEVSKATSATESSGVSAAAPLGGSLFGRSQPESTKPSAAPSSTTQSIFATPSLTPTTAVENPFANLNKSKEGTETTKKDSPAIPAPKFQFGNSAFGTTSKPEEISGSGLFKPSTNSPAEASTGSATPSMPAFNPPKPLFGGLSGAPKPASSENASTPSFKPSLFPSTANNTQASFPTAFEKKPESNSLFFPAPATTAAPTSSIFPPITASKTLFGSPADESEPKLNEPHKSMFGAPTTNSFSQNNASTGFSWTPQTTADASNKPLFSAPPVPAFSKVPPVSTEKESEKTVAEPTSASTVNSEVAAGRPFGGSSSVFQSTTTPQPSSVEAFKPHFTPAPAPKQTSTSTQADTSVSGALIKKPPYEDLAVQTEYPVDSEVSQLMPPEDSIPPGLSKVEKDDWIKRWRFQYINEGFKQQIAGIDASCNDFEALIAYYVMLRAQIGQPCSLISQYRPAPSGSNKRKADEDEEAPTSKRSKGDGTDALFDITPRSEEKKATMISKQFGNRADEVVDSGKAKANDEGAPTGNSERGAESNGSSDTLRMFISSYVAAQERQPSPKPYQDDTSGEKETASNSHIEQSSSKESNSFESAESPASSNGRSLFDRVQLDQSGQPLRQVDEKEEGKPESFSSENVADNPMATLLSGSKFASALNSPGALTPQFSFASGSNTRSPSPLNPNPNGETPKAPPPSSLFAGNTSFPKFSFSADSGTSTPKAEQSSNGVSTPNLSALFGTPAPKPLFSLKSTDPVKSADNALLFPPPPSTATSLEPSRAATPTVSEAGGAEEESANLPQVDFTKGGAGEADEDVKFEVRARALKLKPGATWEAKGVGLLRILKNKNNGRARLLLRADPSGNVILNSSLIPEVDYVQRTTSVQFLVPTSKEAEQWAIKVKEAAKASELAAAMEEYKKRD